jgi:signal transduction histidine kinase
MEAANARVRRNRGSFASRMVITYLVILLLVGATGVLALLWHDNTSKAREVEARSALGHLVLGERLRGDIERTLASSRGYLLAPDAISLERAHEAEADATRVLHDLESRVQTQDGHQLLGRVVASFGSYRKNLEELVLARGQGLELQAVADHFERELLPRRHSLDEAIDSFIAYREARLTGSLDAIRRREAWALAFGVGLVLISVGVAGLVSWRSTKLLVAGYRRVEDSERKAQRAVSAREELLATVAHDLRSPLSAIIMKAATIRKLADLEKARERAASIENVSIRMEFLIRSLLDAASLEAGRFSICKTRCDLGELLTEAVDMFTSLARPKSIRLETTKPVEVKVFADRERVLQVMSNLIGNAVKFTPEGGRISVSAARDADDVRVSVSDSGPGIAPEHVPHLFEQFWQVETGLRRGGAGLGLYIAKGIVEAHAGRLWVESEPGRGANFQFTLPAFGPPGADGTATAGPPAT